MTDKPISEDAWTDLMRMIRETIREEMKAEFQGREAMALTERLEQRKADLAAELKRIDAGFRSSYRVPTHVAGTPV